ncbi:MAG: DNA replication/repair protein RecF [Legionella sp.]
MILADLHIHALRNISTARLQLHPHCNLFVGPNGSGKTSLLESIYLLSTGRSFRTHEVSPLISHEHDRLTVFGSMTDEQTISVQKLKSGSTTVRINRQSCLNSSELAYFFPSQICYQDIFQIIDSGPAIRRSMLDWGLFHVEPSYHKLWQDFKRVLKQRNALLKRKTNISELTPWNHLFVTLAEQLDLLRTNYISNLKTVFNETLSNLSQLSCSITYYKGWDKKESGKSLSTTLLDCYDSDLQRQYSQYGPHQADILFYSTDFKAKQILSRGQQKIILIALKLAQTRLLNKPCIYLLDDIASELDHVHLQRFLAYMFEQPYQFILTAIQPTILDYLKNLPHASFTVEHGMFHVKQAT